NFGRFRRVHPRAPLRPWMIGVLTRKISDLRRDHIHRPEPIPGDLLDDLAVGRSIEVDPARDGEAAYVGYAPILDRVRRRCTARNNWLAFRGVVLEGRSAAEVAAALGMAVADVYTAKARGLRRFREEVGAEAAPLRPEFDERTWSLFLEVAVAGTAPEAVARGHGLTEPEVNRAVAQVLRRLRERLCDRR